MQIFLAAISNEAIVSSFTAFAFAPGALKTGTPLSLIASTGILFTPAPARPIASIDRGILSSVSLCERRTIDVDFDKSSII